MCLTGLNRYGAFVRFVMCCSHRAQARFADPGGLMHAAWSLCSPAVSVLKCNAFWWVYLGTRDQPKRAGRPLPAPLWPDGRRPEFPRACSAWAVQARGRSCASGLHRAQTHVTRQAVAPCAAAAQQQAGDDPSHPARSVALAAPGLQAHQGQATARREVLVLSGNQSHTPIWRMLA